MLEIINYNTAPILQIRNATYPFAVTTIATIAILRTTEPSYNGQIITLLGNIIAGVGGGNFRHDTDDTGSDDNNLTIVTAGGKRWKRIIEQNGTNILYDTWNKKTQNSLNLGGWNWYDSVAQTFTTSATNIPTTTPKIAYTGTFRSKVWDFTKLNLKTGDIVTVSALVWSASEPLRASIFLRNSSNTTIFTDNGTYDTATGMRIITNQFTVPADAEKEKLVIRINSANSVAVEIGAISASVGNYIAPFTELDAFTDYEKIALGVTAMESDILSAKTKTDFLTISSPANIGTMQSDITTLQGSIGKSANLFPDPFNETVLASKQDDIYGTIRASFDLIDTASPNTPFSGKPVLKATTTGLLRRYINYKLLGIRDGESFRVRVLMYYNGTGSTSVTLRNSAGTTLQSFTLSNITAGLIDYTTPAFTGNASGHDIFVSVNESNDLDRELIAIAVCKGTGTPEFEYAPNSPVTLKSLTNLRNLCPDPFFRRYLAGETLIDGYDLGTEDWSIVDLATNPFKNKKAQFFASGEPYSQRYFDVKNLGLKIGYRYTVTLGIIAPTGGNFDLGVWFRNANTDSPITSTGTTQFAISSGVYTEISHTVTITQQVIDEPVYLVCRHNASNTNFADGYYICAWAIYENDTGQEIVDEDYQIDVVNLRVKALEDAETAVAEIPYEYNKFALRETKQRLQKLKLAETAQLKIAIHGTSTTQLGTRYITPLTTELISEYGDAGGGFLGFGFISSSNGNVRNSIYTYARTGTWTSDYYSALSADLSTVESSTAGSSLTIAGPAGTPILSGVDLHWVATSNGVVRYSWNGGTSWTTLNVQGTLGTVNIATLIGHPTTGNFSLIIEVVSGSVILSGINIKSTANGIQVHKLGNSGGRLQHLAEINNTEWIKTIINLSPNVFFLFHGGNDQDVGRTPVQFADNLRTVIDRIKAALPACDIGVIMPPAVVEPRTTPLALYTAEALKVAKEKKVAFIDLQKVFGDDPSEYASYSPRPWFNSDDIHPEPATGGRAIVSALYRHIKY